MPKTPHATGHAAVVETARLIRELIGWASTILVLVFGWLKINEAGLVHRLSSLPANMVHELTLGVYFISWGLGCKKDVDLQEVSYVHEPRNIRAGVLLLILLAVVFGVLCYVQSSPLFLATLVLFWMVDFFGWRFLTRRIVHASYLESKRTFEQQKNVEALVRLELTREHIAGPWRQWRLKIMGVLLAVLALFWWSPGADLLHDRFPAIPADVFLQLGVAAFVAVTEAWIWLRRFSCSACHDKVGEIVNLVKKNL